MCCYLDDARLFLCLIIVVHESLVCSEQFNWALFFRNIIQLLHSLWVSSSDRMISRFIFSHRGQLRDSNTTIKKASILHWCSRRKHDALRAWIWRSGLIVLNLSSGKHASIFCCFRRAVLVIDSMQQFVIQSICIWVKVTRQVCNSAGHAI